MTQTYFLALGSNLGRRSANLRLGLELLGRHGRLVKLSSVYITKPESMPANCINFFNMVVKYESRWAPLRLLCLIKAIERRLGRPFLGHNLPRPLDIDILLAQDQQMQTKHLTLPHPGITSRLFVLAPLLEIEPGLHDPGSATPYGHYLKKLSKAGLLGRFRLSGHRIAR